MQDFWFTADETCVPGGPAFDYTYYNTYTAIVGSVMAWVGVILFESFFSGWSFRNVFFITTILQARPTPPALGPALACSVRRHARWELGA